MEWVFGAAFAQPAGNRSGAPAAAEVEGRAFPAARRAATMQTARSRDGMVLPTRRETTRRFQLQLQRPFQNHASGILYLRLVRTFESVWPQTQRTAGVFVTVKSRIVRRLQVRHRKACPISSSHTEQVKSTPASSAEKIASSISGHSRRRRA